MEPQWNHDGRAKEGRMEGRRKVPFWALEGRWNCHRGSTNLCLRFVAAQGISKAPANWRMSSWRKAMRRPCHAASGLRSRWRFGSQGDDEKISYSGYRFPPEIIQQIP